MAEQKFMHPPAGVKPGPTAGTARPATVSPGVLPTTDLESIETLEDYKVLIHSLSGHGKTSFVMSIQQYVKSVVIDAERGTLAHSGRIIRLKDWEHFVSVVNALISTKHDYKIVCIDPLDALYNMAWAKTNLSLGVSHPAEAAHGKGYDRITSTIMDQLAKLQLSGLGLVCTVHSMIGTIKQLGTEYNQFQPSFVGGSPRSAYKRMEDFFDIIGFLHIKSMVKPPTSTRGDKGTDIRVAPSGTLIEEEIRVLDFGPSLFWVSKDRSGRLHKQIIMPDAWQEDWAMLNQAWEAGNPNKQEEEVSQAEGK